jgi:hypothetical protein
MYQRTNIPLGSRGDSHRNGIAKITPTSLDKTLESYLEERELLLNFATQPIIKAHVRNIPLCLDITDKVVYINFQEKDIPQITLNYFSKNNITFLPEQDYNNMRGKDWPTYQQYVNGAVVAELVDHQLGPAHEWYWILPIDQQRLHKIEFIDLFSDSKQWIHDLVNFLGLNLDLEQQQYLIEIWSKYKILQPKLSNTKYNLQHKVDKIAITEQSRVVHFTNMNHGLPAINGDT